MYGYNEIISLSPEEILQIKSSTNESVQNTRFGSKRIVSVDTKGNRMFKVWSKIIDSKQGKQREKYLKFFYKNS